jgi:leucyl/phenylalanyl-tRNA--protein transferase
MSAQGELTPALLLQAYAKGYFPMAASSRSRTLHWYSPDMRGILPLENFHVPRSLARFMRRCPFTITVDKAFTEVMRGCADREHSWINDTIVSLYGELHKLGHAHSVECWQGDALVGGIYGVSLGGAFFGESMFSRRPNASKVALAHLVELLKNTGYTLFDTQYGNEHIAQFGVIEIPKEEYLKRLETALLSPPNGGVWS